MAAPQRQPHQSCGPWAAPGDWFEAVLSQLAPSDISACRLVSCAWRAQVSVSLGALGECLAVGPEAAEAAVAALSAAFPKLRSLTLRLCGPSPGSPQPPYPLPSAAPMLGVLPRRLALRTLALEAPGTRGPTWALCPLALRHLRELPSLRALSLAGLEVQGGSGPDGECGGAPAGWALLMSLSALELSDCSLVADPLAAQPPQQQQQQQQQQQGEAGLPDSNHSSDGSSGVAEALRPLAPRLRRLALRGRVEWEGSGRVGVPAGLGSLVQLEELILDGEFSLPPPAWAEVAALPRLLRLTFRRSQFSSPEYEEAAITSQSLAVLAEAAPRLQALALGGHTLVGDAGAAHIARLEQLRELELSVRDAGPAAGSPPGRVTDRGLRRLSTLTGLQSLRLGGYSLAEGACGALAGLLALTSLQLRCCDALRDEGLHRLSALRGLRDLALVDCPGVSDIGICYLLKHTTGLLSLDLSGCDKNLTDTGLASVGLARQLTRLQLAHCERISEAGLAGLLPRLEALAHLSLKDCPQLLGSVCTLLAARVPTLETLNLEYCKGVGDQGVAALAGLRQLHRLQAHKCGASEAALAALVQQKVGRPLQLETKKPCWWMASGAAG